MRTAIVYASKHGTTEEVAGQIRKGLGEEKAQLFNLKTNRNFDITQFDQVIVGGSIHAGQIQKRVKDFCEQHTADLLKKRLGLFLCCMEENEAENQFNRVYPEILRSHALSNQIMGGEFRFDRMNFFEKAIVKKVSGVRESVSNIRQEKVEAFIQQMQGGT